MSDNAQQPTTEYPDKLHPSLRATFVRLPTDPAVPLSREQLEALFAGATPTVLRDLVKMLRQGEPGQHDAA